MKFYYLLFLLICLVTLSCNKPKKGAQVEPNDSIDYYTSRIGSGKLKSDENHTFNLRLLNLLKSENSKRNREKLYFVATNFHNSNQEDLYKSSSFKLLEYSIEANDSLHLGKAYKNLGEYYLERSQNDSSFYYYLKAEEVVVNGGDKSSLGRIYLDMAFIKLYESDFTGSEISASKALTYLAKDDNKFYIYDAYNIIGVCSNELKNYERALEYHNKALAYYKENNLKSKFHLDASSLNNIGYVYQNMGRDSEAIVNFKRALSDKTLFKDNPGLYAMLLDNLAYSSFKLRDFSQLPRLYERSLRIRDSLETDPSGIILNKIHLSQLYHYLRDNMKAKKIAQETLLYSRRMGVASDVLSALNQMIVVDKENAGFYAQEYIKISDSIQQIERTAKDKFARIQYETHEISLEKDKLAEQNRNLLYVFIGTLTIGLLLFIIRNQRAKNRELLLIQAQQKANEEIYNLMISQQNNIEDSRSREKKRIARELHDGVLGRLFGARLNLDSLNRQNSPEIIEKRIEYLTELKNIEQDIREISHDLNREKFMLINNFLAILNNLLEEQQNSFNIEIVSQIDEQINWDVIDNTSKINLYRIIQESLQNINKYANANRVNINIKLKDNSINLTISDDGSGFTVSAKKKGIGLQNMVTRAHEMGGTFDIRSKRGKGTTIVVTLPHEVN